jgi:hypothetical protein
MMIADLRLQIAATEFAPETNLQSLRHFPHSAFIAGQSRAAARPEQRQRVFQTAAFDLLLKLVYEKSLPESGCDAGADNVDDAAAQRDNGSVSEAFATTCPD